MQAHPRRHKDLVLRRLKTRLGTHRLKIASHRVCCVDQLILHSAQEVIHRNDSRALLRAGVRAHQRIMGGTHCALRLNLQVSSQGCMDRESSHSQE